MIKSAEEERERAAFDENRDDYDRVGKSTQTADDHGDSEAVVEGEELASANEEEVSQSDETQSSAVEKSVNKEEVNQSDETQSSTVETSVIKEEVKQSDDTKQSPVEKNIEAD